MPKTWKNGEEKSGKSLFSNFLPLRSGLLDSNQRPRAPQEKAAAM
jgi:hypothetical protein